MEELGRGKRARGSRCRLGLVSFFALLVAATLPAGGALAHSQRAARTADEEVRFLFTQVGEPDRHLKDLKQTIIAGSGWLVFAGDNAHAGAGRVVGRVKLEYESIEKNVATDHLTFTLKVGNYIEQPSFSQSMVLAGDLTASDDPLCDPYTDDARQQPRAVRVSLLDSNSGADRLRIEIPGCSRYNLQYSATRSSSQAGSARLKVVIVHPLRCLSGATRKCQFPATAKPTTLTLTVNGKSATATTAKPTNDDPTPLVVPYGTSLNIRASANAPMPKGWRIEVHHNGDVLSSSGNYATVCQVKSGASSCSVTRPPPTAALTGDVDDIVYAQLLAPTYLARAVQILVNYRK